VEQHRITSKPLGVIIKETYDRREAQWDLPVSTAQAAQAARSHEGDAGAHGGKGGAKGNPHQPKLQPGTLATHTKSGKEICRAWNSGNCSSKKCKREHLCSRITKGGRVCAMKNHTAPECRLG